MPQGSALDSHPSSTTLLLGSAYSAKFLGSLILFDNQVNSFGSVPDNSQSLLEKSVIRVQFCLILSVTFYWTCLCHNPWCPIPVPTSGSCQPCGSDNTAGPQTSLKNKHLKRGNFC
ncbi:hypothetical protein XELAEV_18002555mg, partial [Xenopus laevis]